MSDDDGAGGAASYSSAEVARAWVVKMRGEDAPALRDEFNDWLAAAPENGRAYDRAAGRFAQGAILKTSGKFGSGRPDFWGFICARRWQVVGTAAAMAALLVFAIGAVGAPIPGPLQPGASSAYASEPLVTKRGEIRSFRLPDGSTATLDTDSAADVSMAAGERRLRLSRGRARVSITADPRPFRIEAGTQVISAETATIDIAHEAGGVSIKLSAGAAAIQPSATKASASSTVPIGMRIWYDANGAVPKKSAPTPRSAADWTTGWAEHRSIRLDQLVAEANRYAARPIVIDRRALGAREISGRFHIADSEGFAERIAKLLDLAIDRRADAIHLRQK